MSSAAPPSIQKLNTSQDSDFCLSNPNFFSSVKILCHASSTPLTNLLINLDLLMKDGSITQSNNNCHHYVRQALISAKYLKGLMIQCSGESTFSRRFQVKDSLLELIEICKNPSLQGHLIHYLQLNGKEMLEGNKLYFQETVICLLNNAFQAYQKHAANKLVVLIANIEKTELQIKVVDGATGLLELNDSEDNSTKINDPLKLANKGTGLQFVEEVVTNHFSGSIKIDSKMSRGTTVHCAFPLFNPKQ